MGLKAQRSKASQQVHRPQASSAALLCILLAEGPSREQVGLRQELPFLGLGQEQGAQGGKDSIGSPGGHCFLEAPCWPRGGVCGGPCSQLVHKDLGAIAL